jgi:CopG antitoxin of type II toxin-antitoxin system
MTPRITFNSITEENEFWGKNHSADFVDWSTSISVHLPHLKPALESISLRLRENYAQINADRRAENIGQQARRPVPIVAETVRL